MAMMQWCGGLARRVMQRAERTAVSASLPALCGRGDKRTKRGKRFKGSYGNARPKREKKIERIKDKVEVPRRVKKCKAGRNQMQNHTVPQKLVANDQVIDLWKSEANDQVIGTLG